ncbi:MAG TPA: hypothetical protein DCS63_01380 [Elusimicrobia bacterium]|nr:hypothetical protein [Elusimicrobiota bacterium]
MKKSVNSAIFISLVLAPLCVFAQAGALDAVLARTESALAGDFLKAAGGMPSFTVPPPVSIAPRQDRAADTQAADYLPLDKRFVYEYEYTSSEFAGAKTIRLEYMEYSETARSVKVNMIVFNKTKPRVSDFVMTAGDAGIRSSDSPLAGPRLEIPFPLVYNQTWNEGSDRNRVAALNAKVSVPAGVYSGCLKITTRLGGGDAGAAERYYAPGVGLVYEQVTAEDSQQTIKLVSYQLRYAGMH